MTNTMKGITTAFSGMTVFSAGLFALTYAPLYCYATIAFGAGFLLSLVGLIVTVSRPSAS